MSKMHGISNKCEMCSKITMTESGMECHVAARFVLRKYLETTLLVQHIDSELHLNKEHNYHFRYLPLGWRSWDYLPDGWKIIPSYI